MKDFEHDFSLFQEALEIQEPWYVSDYKVDHSNQVLHIYLSFERGATFTCPHCGHSHAKVHDIVNDDRTWRHLNFWQYTTYLHARLPRVACDLCGKTRTVVVNWSRPKAGFTWFFESEAMTLMKEMPVSAVARKVGEHDTRLWRIFHYYVRQAMEEVDLSQVKRIAIDETSSKRGHHYVTLFVDVDTKRVLFATEGKDATVLKTFKDYLIEKEVSPEMIEEVCCDMSPAFISGIEEHFPKAHITFDKFHVMKIINEALDQVRRTEQAEAPELKKTRYIWLKNQDKLTENQQVKLFNLKDTLLKTARAYRLKLALQGLWTRTFLYAPLYFEDWYTWAVHSQLEPMAKAAKTLKKHEKGVLRWFTSKMTNGLLEGINGLVQASKRKARGYRSTKNFIAMIYATVNKLTITVKPPIGG
ncbi:transposase [Scopulibacillus darangshiensis]|uniref:Transposase n=1 Tax=Scopulibacillus darangshiensis TaxID=442528 RepID=A0A4R2N693_9BACL|nr:ISL3 family transposase [Scopulibacillus darangshiensis]TCP16328.1 transposase [Scopulibacillus darangshiensis]